MAGVKYKETIKKLKAEYLELWSSFKIVHDEYVQTRQRSVEFHSVGKELVEKIRDAERILCAGMGRGQYSQYTTTLADKLWGEIRKELPGIDLVGVRSSRDT
jgi:methionyl-tRNA synthetase